MLLQVLAAIGRAFAAVIVALWEHLAVPALRGVGHGLEALLRRFAPWVIGGAIILTLVNYAPEAANTLISLAIVAGVAYVFIRYATRRH